MCRTIKVQLCSIRDFNRNSEREPFAFLSRNLFIWLYLASDITASDFNTLSLVFWESRKSLVTHATRTLVVFNSSSYSLCFSVYSYLYLFALSISNNFSLYALFLQVSPCSFLSLNIYPCHPLHCSLLLSVGILYIRVRLSVTVSDIN